MKLFKTILLIGTILSTQLATTIALGQDVKKDSIIPTPAEAIALMKNICGAGNITKEQAGIGCKTCPSFTTFHDTSGSLTSVVYGSFTKTGTREALVDLNGCEPHANNYGGTVLLRRTSNGWSRIRYQIGFRSYDCLKINTSTDHRNSLVCEIMDMAQGNLFASLDQIEIGSAKNTTTNLLAVNSNTGTCRPPYYQVEIKDFFREDNKLIVKVSEAREAEGIHTEKNSEDCITPKLPKSKLHQLTFLFNGQSFSPTSATAELIKQFKPY